MNRATAAQEDAITDEVVTVECTLVAETCPATSRVMAAQGAITVERMLVEETCLATSRVKAVQEDAITDDGVTMGCTLVAERFPAMSRVMAAQDAIMDDVVPVDRMLVACPTTSRLTAVQDVITDHGHTVALASTRDAAADAEEDVDAAGLSVSTLSAPWADSVDSAPWPPCSRTSSLARTPQATTRPRA